MYAVMQMGELGRDVYETREEAQDEADALNADADDECGDEIWGDGAATVVEVDGLEAN